MWEESGGAAAGLPGEADAGYTPCSSRVERCCCSNAPIHACCLLQIAARVMSEILQQLEADEPRGGGVGVNQELVLHSV